MTNPHIVSGTLVTVLLCFLRIHIGMYIAVSERSYMVQRSKENTYTGRQLHDGARSKK